jgi:hypothetical protein
MLIFHRYISQSYMLRTNVVPGYSSLQASLNNLVCDGTAYLVIMDVFVLLVLGELGMLLFDVLAPIYLGKLRVGMDREV